jgi:mRNA interferase MazF
MMVDAEVRRGCIYLVNLDPDIGSGHGKRRPALVVQNDLGNGAGATTIVVALSSSVPSRLYPFHVRLPAEILGRPGIIMCEHMRTVSLERVDPHALGECPPAVMEQVGEALRYSLGLPPGA